MLLYSETQLTLNNGKICEIFCKSANNGTVHSALMNFPPSSTQESGCRCPGGGLGCHQGC